MAVMRDRRTDDSQGVRRVRYNNVNDRVLHTILKCTRDEERAVLYDALEQSNYSQSLHQRSRWLDASVDLSVEMTRKANRCTWERWTESERAS